MTIKLFAKQLMGLVPKFKNDRNLNTEYLGSIYGGWTICPDLINEKSIIYSFGVGEDITFDTSLMEKYKVNIFAFDPTPKSIKWVNKSKITKGI